MLASDRDTIVAIATAPGEGAIGLVRLSGSQAVAIADTCFKGRCALAETPERTLTYGRFVSSGQDLDEILACVMRGPRSFTGEDTVELNCHGGPFLLGRIVEALTRHGARQALRGEFTKRAFLNGKLDLSQAEAVADMIASRSDLGLRSAFFQLRGGLRHRFSSLLESLRQAMTVLEAGLDFSEDVDGDLEAVEQILDGVLVDVEALLVSYSQGKIVREGALVTLIGKPNVGKSSLMNRLLEEDRAIVTDIPGTTRDTIEESVDLDGLRVTLVDTAGLRNTLDPVEREGARRSVQVMDRASFILFLVDGSVEPDGGDFGFLADRGVPYLVLLNKADLGIVRRWMGLVDGVPHLEVSAMTGEGLGALRSRIRAALLGRGGVSVEALTKERHFVAVRHCRDAVLRALQSLRAGRPGELVSVDIREALEALSEIVGLTTSDDILDRIFSAFCIGK